jgi:hypothetical protein
MTYRPVVCTPAGPADEYLRSLRACLVSTQPICRLQLLSHVVAGRCIDLHTANLRQHCVTSISDGGDCASSTAHFRQLRSSVRQMTPCVSEESGSVGPAAYFSVECLGRFPCIPPTGTRKVTQYIARISAEQWDRGEMSAVGECAGASDNETGSPELLGRHGPFTSCTHPLVTTDPSCP